MVEVLRPRLYTVPVGTSLVDALALHLLQQHRDNSALLADTLILLPNNRAIKALTDSFVRHAKGGLLLPRMVAVGDLSLDEALGPLFDPLGSISDIPILPAINDIERRIILTQLIRQRREKITAVEAFRLAKHLAAAMDLLEVEEISLGKVRRSDLSAELQTHWQSAYADFLAIAAAFQQELAVRQKVTAAARRNLLLDRFAAALPIDRPIIAAGITTAAPAIARLLKSIMHLSQSMLVWPHIDLAMSDKDWDALGPVERDGLPDLSEESHPQYHLKLLFDRMAIRREEIEVFPGTAIHPSLAVIDQIFCRAESTLSWIGLTPSAKLLKQARLMSATDSSEEALAIAILIREALEVPEKRIALITPDRELAVRVAAQLCRWNISVDDSAGQPLVQLPPATLMLALAEMFADQVGPISLLSVLKHPLVKMGEERLLWLGQVRDLDMVLRGPRLGLGLKAVEVAIAASTLSDSETEALLAWWGSIAPIFVDFGKQERTSLSAILDILVSAATLLTDGAVWQGQAGRQLAALIEDYRTKGLTGLGDIDRAAVPAMLSQLFDSEVIRPVYGSHPRVAIYGLLEARMQQADFVVCAGLNEGTWPQLPQPDPWLAPRLRRELGLPGIERNIGLSAHDLASLLGAEEVVLSRAERDRSGPTVASRFLLRIQALSGEQLQQETKAIQLARMIDAGAAVEPALPPQPMPSKEQRLVNISVTQVELLKADPYSFYARNILGLKSLNAVGGEPDAAWRGIMIHDVLEKWAKEDRYDPDRLLARAGQLLANPAFHPAVRILWQPRVTAALEWIATETRDMRDDGRNIISTESWGRMPLAGVELIGRADRIDRLTDSSLVIVDYKSGQPPSKKSVKAGFSLQLGLIGAMAENSRITSVSDKVLGFEYWSLAKRKDGGFGLIKSPVSDKDGSKAEFIPFALAQAREAIETWITGDAPFTAKLHPEYAPYGDYDQLMRLSEWYGRQEMADVA
jgi:ATP-dependent helicase/nuclease subunit B